MNKKVVIGVLIALVVIIVLIFAFSGKKEPVRGGGINVINATGEQAGGAAAGGAIDANAVNIQTSDDVFNQLDNAANYAG